MTAAQRATLEQMADYAERFARMDRSASMSSVAAFHAHRADALRAALGTCENCAHGTDAEAVGVDETHCARRGGFYTGRLMRMSSRCADWEPL